MSQPNLFVGTSGFSYKEWKGSFYPKDLPADKMLEYYGQRFSTVEINNSFYRMPKPAVLEEWTTQVPPEFRFVIKASQRITHFQRLKGCEETVAYLLEVVAELGERLGPLLFQLHPNMKKDAARLADFLKLLPRGARAAFEFRNATWFDDEIFGILRDHSAVLCIAEAENDLVTPFESTADWGYIRLRMVEYTTKELKDWVKRVQQQKWKDAFVFFKHEDEATGPKMAKKFLELAVE